MKSRFHFYSTKKRRVLPGFYPCFIRVLSVSVRVSGSAPHRETAVTHGNTPPHHITSHGLQRQKLNTVDRRERDRQIQGQTDRYTPALYADRQKVHQLCLLEDTQRDRQTEKADRLAERETDAQTNRQTAVPQLYFVTDRQIDRQADRQ